LKTKQSIATKSDLKSIGETGPATEPAAVRSLMERLVAADQTAKSWREKLDAVLGLLKKNTEKLTEENLAIVAIYLRLLNTGQIRCTEDGRHFRPSHHARAALEIQKRLVRCTTTENAIIIRKIYPWLPSTAAPFQRAEPLTRIRDIAHRNDIPSELKREIKTTLQNKLHRCAAPEDLATSRKLLERITAPSAAYSAEFIEQFKIFHHELREFFNASTLDERLISLQARARPALVQLIKTFLADKDNATADGLLGRLRTLTELRRALQPQDGPAPLEHQHEELLADISLDDFAFALLSQWLNLLVTTTELKSQTMSEPLQLTLENLRLSGMRRNEIESILSELRTWAEMTTSQRDDSLRLLATVQRARRLAESQSTRMISIFAEPAMRLGHALDLAPEATKVFSEAEIRNHLIFQLSKLTSVWLRDLRERLHLPPWDVLVPGKAVGRVKCIQKLEEIFPDRKVVAVVEWATGYEELPANLRGIILAHDLPHLSHLAVRARQSGVVLVACEEPASLTPLRSLDGNQITLIATAERVEWKPASDVSEDAAVSQRATPAKKITTTDVRACLSTITNRPLLRLEEFTIEAVGQKAYGIWRLMEIASENNAFNVPQAVALPFGSFEAAIKGSTADSTIQEWRRKASRPTATEVRHAATRLPALLEQTPVPDVVISAVRRAFGRDQRLMVRSSSNCEDLADLAGAGLYESVPNVSPGTLPAAIRRVWSSLWTERAMLSRREAGIAEDQVFMAVLIQEMVVPDFSFVLHTVSPITSSPDEVYVEVAPGLGETLVSGATRGSPYRLAYDKGTEKIKTLTFANFSEGLWPAVEGGVESRVMDYSAVPLSRDAGLLHRWTVRLGKIGQIVEKALGGPQDIEGVIKGDQVFLVQSRPQQGVPATAS